MTNEPRSRPDWVEDAKRRLLALRRGQGPWGYRPSTAPAVEPTALAGLALLSIDGPESEPARSAARWLASTRNRDGSLGVSVALPEPGWPTPFAMLLWAGLGGFVSERESAARWLIDRKGATLARTPDDPVGHDGSLVGWPWVAGTHSWVEPTAMALLALGSEGYSSHPRALEGIRVLRDRAIAGGGWNCGNPAVFGTRLRPLPAPTSLALLALAKVDGPSTAVTEGIGYLRNVIEATLTPGSLGWAILGLRAWGAEPPSAPGRLALSFGRLASHDPSALDLAVLLLAAADRGPQVLGIVPREGADRDAP